MDCENQIIEYTNQKNFQNNVQLIQKVKKRLCEKQYQATLGIGSLFYAFIGFIFKVSNNDMDDWNIPNYLFYTVLGYYLIYCFYIIDQYLVISSVYDEISKQNVVSFSITIEVSLKDEFKKQNFNKNLLDKISFKNTKLHVFGFVLFLLHLFYVILCLQNDTQAFIFLLIIFTGYYINIAVYFVVFIRNSFKFASKLLKKQTTQPKIEHLNEEMCCICLVQFEENDSIQQYSCCSNLFHQECIESWKQVKNSCPLCRCLI
ncbi:hypothetical protein ABPG74_002481 [Tetrahymena malaccensis]